MVRRIVFLSAASIFMLIVSIASADSQKEKATESAALRWLAAVDEGRYADSWSEAATLFKKAIKIEQWEQSLQAVREPLGKPLSRKTIGRTYKTSLPGAPDGHYVILQFQTSFENKKTAIETVTPMLDEDGDWRVSGYYIK